MMKYSFAEVFIMKKIVSSLLTLALMLAGTPAFAETEAQPTAIPTISAQGADIAVADKLDAMHPILDSVARAMGVYETAGYAPSDAGFVWNVIYLTGENWASTHPLYADDWRTDDGALHIPHKVAQEIASAAFFDYDDLPDIADADSVTYDESTDTYALAPSDMSTASTKLDSYTVQENGNISAILGFYDEEQTRVAGFEFTLAPNPYAGGITDASYYYSVLSAALQQAQPEAD